MKIKRDHTEEQFGIFIVTEGKIIVCINDRMGDTLAEYTGPTDPSTPITHDEWESIAAATDAVMDLRTIISAYVFHTINHDIGYWQEKFGDDWKEKLVEEISRKITTYYDLPEED